METDDTGLWCCLGSAEVALGDGEGLRARPVPDAPPGLRDVMSAGLCRPPPPDAGDTGPDPPAGDPGTSAPGYMLPADSPADRDSVNITYSFI